MTKQETISKLLQEERLLDEAQYKFLDADEKTNTFLFYEKKVEEKISKKTWYSGSVLADTITLMANRKNEIRVEMNKLSERRAYTDDSALRQCRVCI